MKNIYRILILCLPLMAFQCEDEQESNYYEYNKIKINVTPNNIFSLQDTIWIKGIVSSNVFDSKNNDSIFIDEREMFLPSISLYKLFTPTNNNFNAIDAIDNFEIVNNDNISYLGRCENSTFFPSLKLSENNEYYYFKLGIRPKQEGDFIINLWTNSYFTNLELNHSILESYAFENPHLIIGYNTCDRFSSKGENEIGDKRDFIFSVIK